MITVLLLYCCVRKSCSQINVDTNHVDTNHVDTNQQVYFTKRNELSTEQGCLLCCSHVHITSTCHQVMVNELRAKHRCINQAKAMVNSYDWWLRMDAAVKNMVEKCAVCHSVKK